LNTYMCKFESLQKIEGRVHFSKVYSELELSTVRKENNFHYDHTLPYKGRGVALSHGSTYKL